jgi:hypothetical protein
MSHFDLGANSSSGLGHGVPNLASESDFQLASDFRHSTATQQHPVALPLVNLEGHVDFTLDEITHDNLHAIPASDQPSLGLGNYQVPASRIEGTHTGNHGFKLRSLLEPYADGGADNLSASGTGSLPPTQASNVCFTSRFVIY